MLLSLVLSLEHHLALLTEVEDNKQTCYFGDKPFFSEIWSIVMVTYCPCGVARCRISMCAIHSWFPCANMYSPLPNAQYLLLDTAEE